MTKKQYQEKAEEVYNFIREMEHVSFIELKRRFPEFVGEHDALMPGYQNVVLWTGLSEEAGEVVSSLLASGRVAFKDATWLTYMLDGGGLSLPIAKNLRSYKKPHWLPVAFVTAERMAADKKRRSATT